jgi:hypothetical protein
MIVQPLSSVSIAVTLSGTRTGNGATPFGREPVELVQEAVVGERDVDLAVRQPRHRRHVQPLEEVRKPAVVGAVEVPAHQHRRLAPLEDAGRGDRDRERGTERLVEAAFDPGRRRRGEAGGAAREHEVARRDRRPDLALVPFAGMRSRDRDERDGEDDDEPTHRPPRSSAPSSKHRASPARP